VSIERVNIKTLGDQSIIRKVILFAYITVIIVLVVLPLNDAKSSILTDNYLVKIRLDYLVHIIIFLPFILLVKISYTMNILNIIFLGLLFAGICEGVQYLLPYRSFNINDLLANMIGTAIGIILVVGPVLGWLKGKVKDENVEG